MQLKKLLLLLLTAGGTYLQAVEYGPYIRFGKAEAVLPGTVKVDGKLDETVWKKAEKLSGFRRASDRKPAQTQTTVMVAFDKDKLYLAWVAPGKTLPCLASRNDVGAIFGDETLEFFSGDPAVPTSFRQFALTPANYRYDALDGDHFINFNWQSAVNKSDDGYTAEMSIMWKDLGIDPVKEKYLRVNFSRSRRLNHEESEPASWSMVNKGYREISGFGFVLLTTPEQALSQEIQAVNNAARHYAKDKTVAVALKELSAGKPVDFIDFKNRLVKVQQAVKSAQTHQASSGLSKKNGRSLILLSNWNEKIELEDNKEFQLPLLIGLVKKPDPAQLNFVMAVNEFAHRSFLISALQKMDGVTFEVEPLYSKDGKLTIPADRVSLHRIVFLRPSKELWPGQFAMWSGRLLPELVELIDAPLALNKYQSSQIRVLIDSDGVAPGEYQGRIRVSSAKGKLGEIPLTCRVLPITLPSSKTNPLWVEIFTAIPYAGESGKAWAKMFRDHYASDVTFETPTIRLNGKRLTPPPHIKDSTKYIQKMVNSGIDFSGKIEVDGKFSFIADRLKICAEFGLRPIFCNRTEDIYPETFPQVIRFMSEQGISPKNFIYKTGDEDTSLWQMPIAEKIHSISPEIQMMVIPSGRDYFDIKPLAKYYRFIGFTRSGLSNSKFEPDLRQMQRNGIKLGRYTNRTSWAERDVRLAGRQDIWDVLIRDRMDGYMVWTGHITSAWYNYQIPYSGAAKKPVHDFAPEEQSTCQLIYVRKQGDFYKPISCIRLEDMRDGLTDYLYYREAEKALRMRKDPDAEKKLAAVVAMPKKTPADFAAIRIQLLTLILGKQVL